MSYLFSVQMIQQIINFIICTLYNIYTKDCDTCKSSFVVSEVYSQQLPATLVNMKTRGGLIHPNMHFFNFIRKIEESFAQHSSSANVFELITIDLMKIKPLSFPCAIHGEQIIAYTVMYYIRMRMRQFAFQESRKENKINRNKKKIAKFCKT